MVNLGLSRQIVTLEIRKIFSYRTDFWLSFVGSTLVQFAAAWFLWKSIFTFQHVEKVGAFTFPALMFYYLLVPVVGRAVYGGFMGDIAMDIYQGTLTRYLIYPVSFFRFKLLTRIANTAVLAFQITLALIVVMLFVHDGRFGSPLTLLHIFQGTITIFAAALLYFTFTAWIQLIAFWADQVWSLSAIIRFITSLLGGGLVPLTLFPATLQPLLSFLPFSYFISFPASCFMGTVTLHAWLQGLGIMGCWGVLFALLWMVIWQKGIRTFAGVGI